MTHRRLSKRSTAVTKRRVLEEKLEKRREEVALRSQKKKSKALQELQSQEIDSEENRTTENTTSTELNISYVH